MKNQVAVYLGLGLSLLVLAPASVQADAVTTWNENAAKAATAACVHISGNGLAEARMYAMVHAAVHDAVNAIDRRSRPYAFDATVSGPVSVDAAVAAAARDVLVSVIATMPELPACIANGIANANASYTAALAAIPSGPAKTNGVSLGQAAAAAIIAQRVGDKSDAPWVDPNYPQGTEPGEWRFTPDQPMAQFAFAPNWGEVTPFVLKRGSQFRPRGLITSRAASTPPIITRSSGSAATTSPPQASARRTRPRSACSGSRARHWRGTGWRERSRPAGASTSGRTRDCSGC